MRIIVVDVPADQGGALSILHQFHQYVMEQGKQHEWVFMVSTPELEQAEHVRVIRYPWIRKSLLHRLFWDYVCAASFIKKIKADAVLSLQNMPVPRSGVPNIVYIHQALPFQTSKNYSFARRDERGMAFYQHIIGRLIKSGIRRAHLSIVQSEWMKQAILNNVSISSERIQVIKPDVQIPDSYRSSQRAGESIQTNRFFYPAAAVPYKNHQCIIRAASILYDKGWHNFSVELTITEQDGPLAQALFLASNTRYPIKFLGKMSQTEVYERLTDAILLFPSYIETVGLPLLEARAIGSMILASDTPFSRDNLKDYPNVRFFDPLDPQTLADEMERILTGQQQYAAVPFVEEEPAPSTGWESIVSRVVQGVNRLNNERGH